jgi:hypothetical protein
MPARRIHALPEAKRRVFIELFDFEPQPFFHVQSCFSIRVRSVRANDSARASSYRVLRLLCPPSPRDRAAAGPHRAPAREARGSIVPGTQHASRSLSLRTTVLAAIRHVGVREPSRAPKQPNSAARRQRPCEIDGTTQRGFAAPRSAAFGHCAEVSRNPSG